MAIRYRFVLPDEFPTQVDADGLKDVIRTVDWRYVAEEGDITAEERGQVDLPRPRSDHFTPHDEVTKEMLIEWITPFVDIPEMQRRLAAKIEQIKSPPVVMKPLTKSEEQGS